jgi:hypothetical protein
MMAMIWAVLAMPGLAMADGQTIPPEANWSPRPPARSTVEVNQLATLLVHKGVITPHEYSRLTRPQVSPAAPHGHGRAWTWDDIDRHSDWRTSGD